MSIAFIGPIRSILSVTTSDNDPLDNGTCRAIYCGVTGDIKITTPSGEDITLVNVAAGIWHPIMATKIFATGTDATNIFAGY